MNSQRSVVFRFCFSILFFATYFPVSYSQIVINDTPTAAQIVNEIVGPGVSISNVTMNCPSLASGVFSNGLSTNLGIDKGVVLTTGKAIDITNPGSYFTSIINNGGSEPLLTNICNPPISFNDVCRIEFDVVPLCPKMEMSYVFGSEEYPEFVCTDFNDAFGFFVTGPNPLGGNYTNKNIATIGGIPVTVNSVNNGSPGSSGNSSKCDNLSNTAYYINNTGSTIVYDGLTTPLLASIDVTPCETYHMIVVIGDGQDEVYDSGVFLTYQGLNCSYIKSPDTEICLGQSTQLSVTAPNISSFSWAPAASLDNPAIPNPIASPTSTTTYTCTIDNGSCTSELYVTIGIKTIDIGSSIADANCNGNGDGAVVSWGSNGVAPYSYLWSNSDTSSAAFNLAPGTYTVTVTDVQGCLGVKDFTISEPPVLAVSATGSSADCVLLTGDINVGNNGGGSGTGYEYSIDWNNWQSSNSFQGLTSGTYYVYVRDSKGCSAQTTVDVTDPVVITSSILSQTDLVCYGGSNGSFTVTGNGGSGTFDYSMDGTTFQSGGTFTGLTAGNYTITVRDGGGCSVIQAVSLAEPPAITLGLTTTNVTCAAKCDGTVLINASGGTGTLTYTWSGGASGQTVNNICAATYTVAVIDANYCFVNSVVTITEPQVLSATPSMIPSVCNKSDGSASLSITGGTTPYTSLWSNGATGTTILNVLAANYCFTVTDVNNCVSASCIKVTNVGVINVSLASKTNVSCNGGSDGTGTITANGGTAPYTFTWSGYLAQTTANATGLAAGVYTITIMDNSGCFDTIQTSLTEPPPINTILSNPATICIGQNTTLTATVSGGSCTNYTYQWTPGNITAATATVSPVINTTYTLSVTDCNGCAAPLKTVAVGLNPPLTLTVPTAKSICAGSSANINVSASGGDGNYSYSWLPMGSGPSQTVSPTNTTIYTIIVSDGCGTPTDTGYVPVQVNPLPVPAGTSNVNSGCATLCVNFDDQSTVGTGSIVSWAWDLGDAGHAIVTGENPSYCYTNPGSYTVLHTATTDKGCSASITYNDMILVFEKPTAAFTFTPNNATINNPEVFFSDKSIGAISWLWTFGDPLDVNGSSFSQNPSYTYPDTGIYKTTLYIQNTYGCIDSVSEYVSIAPEYTFYIPNAFTPNDDPNNQVFKGQGVYVKEIEMFIFDRWGDMIFQTTDLNGGWNGSVNGGRKMAQQDVYVYVIKVKDVFDKLHHYKGQVTLMK